MDAGLPLGNNLLNNWILQVPLEGLAHQEENRDFYANLFEATHFSVAGPNIWKLNREKYRRKDLFVIQQHFMGEDAVNWYKEKAYSAMESAQYPGYFPRFNYDIITWI